MNEAQISKQHPIPQNFMDVEFKIVGDFTVRQFTYLMGTGFPMYLIYSSPLQGFLKTIILIVLGLFGFLLVFVPIDDRSMDVWIVNLFRSVYSHNRRVWRKTAVVPKALSMEAIRIVQGEMITLAPTSSRRKLEEYLRGIKEEALDEYDFDFRKHKYDGLYAATPVTIAPVTEVIPVEAPMIEATPPLEITQKVIPVVSEASVVLTPDTKAEKPAVQEVVIKIPVERKQGQVVAEKPKEFFMKVAQPIVKPIPSAVKEMIKPTPKIERPVDVHEELRVTSTESPGRRFVSFSKREQEIILPIRGERRIPILGTTIDTPTAGTRDIKTLTKELRTLVREIKNEEPTIQTQATSNEIVSENFLSGLCFDQNNNPLSNLLLVLLDEGNREIQYGRTDNFGKFTFRNTTKGNFKIKVLNPEIYSLNFDIINLSIEKYPYTFIQIIGKK